MTVFTYLAATFRVPLKKKISDHRKATTNDQPGSLFCEKTGCDMSVSDATQGLSQKQELQGALFRGRICFIIDRH